MRKLLSLLLAAVMLLSVTSVLAANEDIVILVPNADHGWTGAVLSYAEEKAKEITDAGVYTARVIASSDPANQITQVEDIIDNKSARTVVILPYDNTLEATMRKLVDSGIPFVMYDRVIDAVAENAVSVVKGDNEGIGLETAKRFVADGLQPGDNVLIIPGDNSSVPEMRNNGFFQGLLEAGWTQEQVDAIRSTAYTGWSRSEGRRLFTEWLDSNTIEDIQANRYIFTHDDEIAMGMLEALKSSDIDPGKKEAFLGAKVNLGTSSGLNEIYSVLRGIHQKDYTEEVAQLNDLFSVTYDPGMIKIAIQDMVDHLDGKEVPRDHVVPVSVVDATNVDQFQGFGDAFAK
ncbi:MAG: substrate-binding domain-containing protein [Clostridiales bacterium]|nr:substrate-binding domain-containing protein [Clostridiales bacterium]